MLRMRQSSHDHVSRVSQNRTGEKWSQEETWLLHPRQSQFPSLYEGLDCQGGTYAHSRYHEVWYGKLDRHCRAIREDQGLEAVWGSLLQFLLQVEEWLLTQSKRLHHEKPTYYQRRANHIWPWWTEDCWGITKSAGVLRKTQAWDRGRRERICSTGTSKWSATEWQSS